MFLKCFMYLIETITFSPRQYYYKTNILLKICFINILPGIQCYFMCFFFVFACAENIVNSIKRLGMWFSTYKLNKIYVYRI